jgi:hypothetical protein
MNLVLGAPVDVGNQHSERAGASAYTESYRRPGPAPSYSGPATSVTGLGPTARR